jgi:hypothetical protein
MDNHHGRRQERVPVEGTLRLLVKSGGAFVIGAGEIVDLSEGGCAIQVHNRAIEPDLKGRIDITVGSDSLSLPIVTRWVRAETDGWIVGCAFDEPTIENLRAIHALISERRAIFI